MLWIANYFILLIISLSYSSLNLPEGTVQGPLSLRGLPTTVKCKNSLKVNFSVILTVMILILFNVNLFYLTCLGTLHHQGSITGLKTDLNIINLTKELNYKIFDLGSFLGKGAKHPTKKQTNKVKITSFVCIL